MNHIKWAEWKTLYKPLFMPLCQCSWNVPSEISCFRTTAKSLWRNRLDSEEGWTLILWWPEELCVVHRKQCIVLLYGRETPRWPGTGLVYNRGTFAIGRPCLEILSLSISYWMCVGVCVRRWNLCIRMWVFARLMFQLLYKTVYMSVCLFPSVLLTLRMCVHRDETKNIYSEREIRQYVHRKLGWSYLLLY